MIPEAKKTEQQDGYRGISISKYCMSKEETVVSEGMDVDHSPPAQLVEQPNRNSNVVPTVWLWAPGDCMTEEETDMSEGMDGDHSPPAQLIEQPNRISNVVTPSDCGALGTKWMGMRIHTGVRILYNNVRQAWVFSVTK